LTEIIKINEVQKTLTEAGFDLETELMNIQTNGNGIDLPRIRIHHSERGSHYYYIDFGENYLDNETQEVKIEGNTFKACIFCAEDIRALWQDGELMPRCSAVNDVPIVENPLSDSCITCNESSIGSTCKKKCRLWVLMKHNGEIKPFIFNLSPTSLKHYNSHKKRLRRSKLPVVAVNTVFTLSDQKKNSYRWAETKIEIDGIVSKEMLLLAKQYRDELNRLMGVVSEKDYSEPGDKVGA
jgi:hypothetical protein